ncbi:glycosyltransferase [Kribbella sp. WER1]
MTAVISAPPIPTVSVVICCYTLDRWQQIVEAIASVQAQTQPAAEIILVVDHSPDLAAQAFTLDGVRVVESDGPRGLSGARNSGVAVSTSDIVAFLDDDAFAAPDWLERLTDEYADPDVLGVGGHVEPDWESSRPAWFPPEFDWVVGCSHSGLPRATEAVRNFVGANMSFRRSVFTQVGGFRPDLGRVGRRPVGCEETELCIRAAAAFPHGVLLHHPQAKVRHHVPAERATWSYFRSRCYSEGLSKAVVSRLTGRTAALSSERDYVRRVLPRGLLVRRRALPLVAGLATTAIGYVAGQVLARRRTLIAHVPLVAALLVWALSLGSVNVNAMTDLGLVSVLSIGYWIAFVTILVTTVVLIHRRRSPAGYLLGLILVIHGTPQLLYGTLRYSWAWKHVGIVDYILRHGAVDPSIPALNAYHAWPGFFALSAVLTKASGIPTLSYAGWAPVVNTALVLLPLWLIFDHLAKDRRRVWFAMLLFVLCNWIGQEYFSPQAFAYILYLTVLAICLRHLGPTAKRQRLGFLGIVLLLMVAIASSHQLTPFMLLSALSMLVLIRKIRPFVLPIALAAITVVWISSMAGAFLGQNLYWIVESIGRPASNTQTTFVDLSQAGPDQQLVLYADRGLTAGIGLLAVLGAFRLRHARAPILTTSVLAFSPLPLLVMNSYGGEMLFRVYLFALPFLALLAAGLVYAPRPARWSLPVAIVCVLATASAFCLAYYGKERANRFTPAEVTASNWLYAHAPRGSTIVGATANFPWAFTHYEYYDYEFLENLPAARKPLAASSPVSAINEVAGTPSGTPVYVVLTASEQTAVRYTGVLPATTVPRIDAVLAHTPGYRVAYRNADTTIYLRSAR